MEKLADSRNELCNVEKKVRIKKYTLLCFF